MEELHFGLDLGATSVGWAVRKGKQLIDAGVQIFPVGVKQDEFITRHVEMSKAEGRAKKRMAARLLKRYKLRREQLICLLADNKMWPMAEVLSPAELYNLRDRGANEQITLSELARLLFWLNQRRGFKSGRKDYDSPKTEKDDQNSEMKKAMTELTAKVLQLRSDIQSINPHRVVTLGTYFKSLYDRGSEIPGQPSEPIRRRFVERKLYVEEFNAIWSEQSKHYPDILTEALKREIGERTIFYQRPLKSAKHLIAKCRFEPQKRVMPKSHPLFQEFRIWQKLADIRVSRFEGDEGVPLTLEQKQMLYQAIEMHFAEDKYLEKVGWEEVKPYLDFRDNEEWNLDEKIFTDLTKVRIANALLEASGAEPRSLIASLTPKEYNNLWHLLHSTEKAEVLVRLLKEKFQFSQEEAEALSLVKLESDYCSISQKAAKLILDEMKTENLDYAAACKSAGDKYSKSTYHHSVLREKDEPQLSIDELYLFDKVKNGLKQKGLLDRYSISLTSPLVKKILSETLRVVRGLAIKYGTPDLITIELARDIQGSKEKREAARKKNKAKECLRGLIRHYLINHLGYPRPTNSDIQKVELFLELEMDADCKEKLKVDLSVGKGTVNTLQDFFKYAVSKTGELVLDDAGFDKYKTWIRCGRVSLYSGKVISFNQLWNGEVEIEHIVPYQISQDNSLVNLSLCEKSLNQEKGKRLPIDWLKSKKDAAALKQFVSRLKRMKPIIGKGKYHRFLADPKKGPEGLNKFNPEYLVATRQAGKIAMRLLRNLCNRSVDNKEPIRVMTGQLTALLRKEWALDSTVFDLYCDFYQRYGADRKVSAKKFRKDHRHHAIDAIICACTTQSMVQQIANQAKLRGHSSALYTGGIVPIMGTGQLNRQVEDLMKQVLVSYRPEGKPYSRRRNPYRHFKKGAPKPVQTGVLTPRGALHKDTYYGKIQDPNWQPAKAKAERVTERPTYHVVRDTIEEVLKYKAKKLEDIIDGGIRSIIEQAIADKLKPEQVFLTTKDGRKIPIKKVRVKKIKGGQIDLGQGRYVTNDDNYGMGIYVSDDRNVEVVLLSFWEVVEKIKKGEPIFPEKVTFEVGRGKNAKKNVPHRLSFVLRKSDLVLLNENDQTREELLALSREQMSDRLFRIAGLSSGDYILIHHLSQGSLTSKDYKPENGGRRIRSNVSLKIAKVLLSPVGEVLDIKTIL